MVMCLMVKHILQNHLYQFGQELYRQECGGPIGLKATTVLARLVMMFFDKDYLAKLSNLNILPNMKQGTVFQDGRLSDEMVIYKLGLSYAKLRLSCACNLAWLG